MATEKDLVEGLVKGDEIALEAFINIYGESLLRIAFAITCDMHIAEEVVQDACMQISRKISSFKFQSSLQTWVYRITINIAKNKMRNSWFKRVSLWGGGEFTIIPDTQEADPENVLISENSKTILLNILNKLPNIYREIIGLYYFEDLTLEEISEILKTKIGTIKSRLSRARVILKKELESEWGDLNG